jgi:hypothetical protein
MQSLQLGQQTMQSNQQAIDSGGIDLREKQAMQQVLKDPSKYTDPQGNVDWNKLTPAVMQAAPVNGPKYIQGLFAAQAQGTAAKQAVQSLDADSRAKVSQFLLSQVGKDPKSIGDALNSLGSAFPTLGPAIEHARQTLAPAMQAGDQKTLDAEVWRLAKSVQDAPSQQSMNAPAGVGVTNNQQSAVVNTKPGADVPVGAVIPGTLQQMQLPPGTPTVGPNNQPGYVGPQSPPTPMGLDAVRAAMEKNGDTSANYDIGGRKGTLHAGGGFVPSGPVPGANESKGGSVQVMNEHWANINKQAENAPLVLGVLGNIKSLASSAITGSDAGKRAYVNGLLNAFGLGNQKTGDLQKDTDLLEKNMAQLNLGTPAATDAMRNLIEAGRPHSTMNSGAIQEAAAQVEGQVKANLAIRNSLSVAKSVADQSGDPTVYSSTRQHLEQVADPRAWQYMSLGPGSQQAKDFLKKLTPGDRAQLVKNVGELERMGLLK